MNTVQQPLKFQSQGGSTAIDGLLVKDYPLFILVK
jgi:hypothetical protein